jgi:hypothetical protein
MFDIPSYVRPIRLPYAKENQNLWENAERISAESKESGPELTNLCIVIGAYGFSWGLRRASAFLWSREEERQ